MSKELKISEFAEFVGTTSKTLRLYESKGLILPQRKDEKGYRFYSREQKKLFDKIQQLKFFGLTLMEIKYILPVSPEEKLFTSTLKIQRKKLIKEQRELELRIATIDSMLRGSTNGPEMGRRMYMKVLSEHIKKMSREELIECTTNIDNKDFLYTVSMVDEEAKQAILSVVSDKARKLVEEDLELLGDKYIASWTT